MPKKILIINTGGTLSSVKSSKGLVPGMRSDDMLEELDARDACLKVRQCVTQCLEEREAKIIILRYGLNGRPPLTQREIAAQCGISRSYV